MEVKPHDNQTEEWRDCDISDLCQLQRGFDLTEATRKRGEIPVYSSSGLSYFHDEARLQPPAVITGRKGLLGKVFFVEEPCWPHDTTLWVKNFKGNHPRFVAMFLEQFRLERFDAATSVPTLNRNNLVGIPIKLPPPPEQLAIAEALSDVDGLLDGLDRIIAKKRDLKQAAMQQLLFGQTRLPGFHGEWDEKVLGNCLLARPDYGINAPAVPYSDRLPTYLRITDISEHGRFRPQPRVSVSAASAQLYYLKEGELVFARTGASVGKSYLYDPQDGELVFAGFLIRVRPNPEKLVPSFLAALTTTRKYWSWVRSMSMRSGQPGINGNEYAQMPLLLPRAPEQAAIAEVLTAMEAELAASEQQREKTRALKQAMMQELLTGRTRLA